MQRVLLSALTLISVFAVPVKKTLCHNCHATKKEKINVHLIPHSHDDVGWLRTFDQYYYGSGVAHSYENAGVQYIISSAVAALQNHPDRRFVQVESAFFWKWWQNQNGQVKEEVVDLVNKGQLEIINGAWSMNDEATTHYHSIIDSYTWGFRFLNDTFGQCARPKIGWQIDPFGHSKEQASLLKQMGFEGLILGRIDYRDKEKRKINGHLDFLWKSSDSLENSYLFTSMFPDLYVSDPGFCFDVICNEKSINDDKESPDFNLGKKVEQFTQRLDNYVNYYATSNILIPMGGDFHFQAAEINFSNMDKLIKGFKNHSKYNIFYSTPSCYIAAVNDEINQELPLKTDDFFPYASDQHSYWTGYYTSRPTLKKFERMGNNILQSAKQLASFSKAKNYDVDEQLNDLRSIMGILQHHDAITGTEKQAVANDYARLLSLSLKKIEESMGKVVSNLIDDETNLKLSTCLLTNVSICFTSQQTKFLVVVQNPLSRKITHYVRLPVNGTNYRITGPDGEEIYDVFDTIHPFDYLQENIYPSSKELVFAARNLPPLGFKVYFIEKCEIMEESNYRPFEGVGNGYLGNEQNGFRINTTTGELASITIRGVQINVRQDFLYYLGVDGSNAGAENRASGAYIFRPSEHDAKRMADEIYSFKSAKGQLCDEFLQVFNDEVRQIIRVYKNEVNGHIEFDWLVGDLQYVNQKGKEVIVRYTTVNFTNHGVFYTDSNGRQQIKRELNKRNYFDYDVEDEPISSNYYPVTSRIVIKENNTEFAVLNDRAQGGSSLRDGEIEMLIHRSCSRDDAFGVGEILAERQYGVGLYVRGQHYLIFGRVEENGFASAVYQKELAQRKFLQPWILLSSIDSVEQIKNFKFEGLMESLPLNVHILTFEPWKEDTFLLRLEHTFEIDEDPYFSRCVTVDLGKLFMHFDITNIIETTLGANEFLEEYEKKEKFIWNGIVEQLSTSKCDDFYKIELNPMQIRTFIVRIIPKDK